MGTADSSIRNISQVETYARSLQQVSQQLEQVFERLRIQTDQTGQNWSIRSSTSSEPNSMRTYSSKSKESVHHYIGFQTMRRNNVNIIEEPSRTNYDEIG